MALPVSPYMQKTSEKKETEVRADPDAVDDIWKSEDTSAASIDETVYVILNADGTQQKIYVSDWLKNQGEKDSLHPEQS